jgi:hypothetical protein
MRQSVARARAKLEPIMPSSSSRRRCLTTTALILCVYPVVVAAAVHEYASASFYPTTNGAILLGGREGVYASRVDLERTTTEGGWISANPRVRDGKAYVRLDELTFARDEATANAAGATGGADGLIEATLFERNDFDRLGVVDDGVLKFCCDADMASRGLCSEVNRLIVRERNEEVGKFGKKFKGGDGDRTTPWRTEIWFDGDDTTARSDVQAVSVDETGMYYLWFVVCDPEHAGVRVSGKTIWKNPDGYLPGAMQPNLGFYGLAAVAYLVLGFVWALSYVGHWKHVLELHNCVTAVVTLGMCEMCAWYFDYANFNSTGYRPYTFTVFAVLLGSLRTTLSRTLVLVVSMGYGVVRPTLGGLNAKVVSLAVCYLFSTAVKDVVEHVGSVDDLKPGAKLFLILPVSVFDSIFLMWIFTSLSKTLTQLTLRKQAQKLSLYRAFTNALAFNVVLSLGWLGYEVWFKSTSMIDEKWESLWMLNAFWQCLSFGLLAVICFLWRPTNASVQYAYSELASDNISEEAWWGQIISEEDIEMHSTAKSPPHGRVMNSAKKTRALHDFSLDDGDDSAAEMGKME